MFSFGTSLEENWSSAFLLLRHGMSRKDSYSSCSLLLFFLSKLGCSFKSVGESSSSNENKKEKKDDDEAFLFCSLPRYSHGEARKRKKKKYVEKIKKIEMLERVLLSLSLSLSLPSFLINRPEEQNSLSLCLLSVNTVVYLLLLLASCVSFFLTLSLSVSLCFQWRDNNDDDVCFTKRARQTTWTIALNERQNHRLLRFIACYHGWF